MSEPIHPEGAILNEALELPADARAAYLDKACAGDAALRQRVEALLQAHEQAQGFLEAPPNGLGLNREDTAIVPPVEKAGDCIGPYKLLQQIGEGGCGVVYMAEQKTPIHRRVALKVIKLGMDTRQVVARFEAERQALALMDHPNIAKVLDAGATGSGRPYFVMELVRGVKITEYCDEARLPIRARLELFIQVCQAVQHAHQKGIIHRDIKPSNILVTVNDGVPVPKVIDFGIAKATSGQQLTDKTVFTAFEQFIGTPAYMSPEQAVLTSLDIDTRSDIYALGVLLYEMLTGKTPFDSQELLAIGLDEMRRTIREKEPERPSTRLTTMPGDELSTTAQRRGVEAPKLVVELVGDLDWIVMTCLEKDRARRYETANALARDIERHLRNEPVAARPAGVVYRVKKFCRRNKVVVTAGAAVVAVLALGTCASTWEAIRARQAGREEIRLRKEAQASEQRALSAQKNEARQREQAEAQTYAADISLAGQALANDNLRQALELLRKHIPKPGEPDLRGFEWRYLWRACRSQELCSLPGHNDTVNALAFSPDGRTLATASYDKTAKLWDVASRREIATLTGDTNRILSVSFSQDGELLATASQTSVRVWETKHFQLIRVLPDVAWMAAFSPVSNYLATCSSNSVLLWDTVSWRVLRAVEPAAGNEPRWDHSPKSGLAFSPDGRRLAVTWNDGIRLFHVPDFQSSGLLQDRQLLPSFTFIAFSPDGHTLAAATLPDKDLKLWSLDNLQPIRVLSGHLDSVSGAAFSPDGKRLATCSSDETVRLWDLDTGEIIRTLRGHEQEVYDVAFSPDGKLLASCGMDGAVKLWDARAGPAQSTQLTGVLCLGFDTQGNLVTWSNAAWTEMLKALDPESLGALGTVNLHGGGKHGWYFTIPGGLLSDGKTAVFPWSDQSKSQTSYLLYDLDRGQSLGSAGTFLTDYWWGFAAAPNSRLLAVAGTNHTVSVWQWPDGVRKCVLTNTTEPLAFSPDGTILVTGSDPDESESGREEIKLWNLQGECLRQFDTPDFSITGHRFSPDGKVLALGTGIITLRAVPSCQPVGRLVGHTRLGLDLSFSPDGRTLASVADDRTVRLWHMATGRQLLVFSVPECNQFPFATRRVLFSPDGRTLVLSGREAGEALTCVWHAPSFAEIAVAEGKDYAPLATNTATWLVTAKALEKANRSEEAVRAFTEVIRRSGSTGDLGPLRSALLHRARLQRRLGQAVEGATDHLAALELPAHDPISATNDLATNFKWALYDLSLNYEDAGYLDEAVPLFEASWERMKGKLGPEHPLAIAVGNDLAWVYLQAGQTNKAVTLFEDAVKLARTKFGFGLPTRDIINNLSQAYRKAGRGEEALRLNEESFKLCKDKLGPEHPDTLRAMRGLANSQAWAGRHEEAIALLEKACALDPKNTDASLSLATFQAWFGKDADYEATRRRLVQEAEGTAQASTAERAAKAYCLRPSTDAAMLAKALTLAQRAVEIGKGNPDLAWYQLGLGLAEYRNGQYSPAERALTLAEQTVRIGDEHDIIQGTARLYRAMSLFRQDRPEECRKLFSQAEAQMPPLPKDESKPLVDGRPFFHDVLIWWLAYKEAKSVINEFGPDNP